MWHTPSRLSSVQFARNFTRACQIMLSGLLALTLLAGSFSACASDGRHLREPTDTLNLVQESLREDRALKFMGALSRDVRDQWGDTILAGWFAVRDQFAFLADDVKVMSSAPFTPAAPTDFASTPEGQQYIWPDPASGRPFRKLTISVTFKGELFTEDLLLVQELDPIPDNTSESPWVRVGEQWIWRADHPNPARHADRPPSEEERSNWRLVYPYHPFQANSAFSKRLLQELNQRSA